MSIQALGYSLRPFQVRADRLALAQTAATRSVTSLPLPSPQFAGLDGLISSRAKAIKESGIRSTSREAEKWGAVNLGQGTPSGKPPQPVLEALIEALKIDANHQYTNTWGIKEFRKAIATRHESTMGRTINPDTEVVVTCGATEGMRATIDALVNPGDEVILFEPFYDNFAPNILMAGGTPKYVQLKPPNWSFDPAEMKAAFTAKTKAIIINTPSNPSGKVFNAKELQTIAELCKNNNTVAISDEIYEKLIYDGEKHISISSLPGMAERTVLLSGLSKAYNATGWRVGYAIAPPELTKAIRTMHDYTSLCISGAYQTAGVTALGLPPSYYEGVSGTYLQKRDFMMKSLTEAGFKPFQPKGSYFILADVKDLCTKLGLADGEAFKDFLMQKVGVAVIPGANFFNDKAAGKYLVRVSFCKDMNTLQAAATRLKTKLPPLIAAAAQPTT